MYIKEKLDGTTIVYQHKMRAMLKGKISELLSRYSLDEVLSEVAAQRPSFDIHIVVAGHAPASATPQQAAAQVK